MKNGKFGLAALCVLFVVFVISGCSSNTQLDAAAGVPINENSTSEEVQQYIDSAVAEGNVNMCLKIPNKMPTCLWTSSCIAQVAREKRDAAICNKISPCEDADELFDTSEFAIDNCRSDIELLKVKDTAAGGPDACMQLEAESKNECLSNAAINKADYAVCELIEDDDEARDVCLFNAIDNTVPENKVLCDKIKSTVWKENCQKVFATG